MLPPPKKVRLLQTSYVVSEQMSSVARVIFIVRLLQNKSVRLLQTSYVVSNNPFGSRLLQNKSVRLLQLFQNKSVRLISVLEDKSVRLLQTSYVVSELSSVRFGQYPFGYSRTKFGYFRPVMLFQNK